MWANSCARVDEKALLQAVTVADRLRGGGVRAGAPQATPTRPICRTRPLESCRKHSVLSLRGGEVVERHGLHVARCPVHA